MKATSSFVSKTVSSSVLACRTRCAPSHILPRHAIKPYHSAAAECFLSSPPALSVPSSFAQNSSLSVRSRDTGLMSSVLGLLSGSVTFDGPAFPKEIVFLGGAPGAGKGTHSAHIASLRGYDGPAIVVSDLLNTPSCQQRKAQGVLVNDEFVFTALIKELQKSKYRNGVVVDGFPRTAAQAEMLKEFRNHDDLTADVSMVFVMLDIDEATSVNRQLSRGRAAMACNEERAASRKASVEVRATDVNAGASKARYDVFRQQMKALETSIARLFPLVIIDASATVENVRETIAKKLACLL